MTPQEIIDRVGSINPDALVLDNLDCCIVGWGTIGLSGAILMYDHHRMLEHFMGVDGGDLEDAQEWIEFNICNIVDDDAPILCRQGDALYLPDAHVSEYHGGEQLVDLQAVRDA